MAVWKDFADTWKALPTDCFWKSLYSITQKVHLSEYIRITCLKQLAIFSTLLKIITACKISKNTAFPQVFFRRILITVPKTFDPLQNSSISFQQVTLYHLNLSELIIDRLNESCRFSTQQLVVTLLILLIVITSWTTLMQKKTLKRKETVNLIFNKTHLINPFMTEAVII